MIGSGWMIVPLPEHSSNVNLHIRVRTSLGTTAVNPSPHVVDLRSSRVDSTPALQTPSRQTPSRLEFGSPKSVFRWIPRGSVRVVLRRGWQRIRAIALAVPTVPIAVTLTMRQWYYDWRNQRRATQQGADQSRALWQALEEHPFLPSLRKELAIVTTLALVVMVAASVVKSIPSIEYQKQTIIRQALAAASQVSAATESFSSGRWPESLEAIVTARQTFEQMDKELERPSQWWLRVIGILPLNTRYHQARRVTAVGRQLSLAAESIVQAAVVAQSNTPPGQLLRDLAAQAKQAHLAIVNAQEELQELQIDSQDASLNQLSQELRTTLASAEDSVEHLAGLLRVLARAMGSKELRRYLVIFENSDEIRPAGGFMGSYVLIDVVDGVIVRQEYPKGGSYDLQGSLTLSVTPPKPLAVFRPQWQFQDVNWFSDWPTSAQTIQWFYQHAGGPSVDGVIAITSPLLERILAIMGPVELEGERLTAETVIRTVQDTVENNYDRKDNNPKEYIGKLAFVLQQKLAGLSKEQVIGLFQLSQTAVRQKLILAYMNDPEINRDLRALGAAGEIRESPDDYLSVVWANIGGQKSDRVITRSALLESRIDPDGGIVNTLSIRREHRGRPGEQFYGVTNTSYVRIYVPEGSEFVSARGFIPQPRRARISDTPTTPLGYVQEYEQRQTLQEGSVAETREFGKTVFGGWVTLPAGAAQSIELIYRLPLRMESKKSLTLMAQKQPGGVAMDFEYRVALPAGSTVVAAAPPTAAVVDTTVRYGQVPLLTDRLYGTIAQLP